MASWLKVAEDLFEVVDRRAKLVASELSEEQTDLQQPVSKGQDNQVIKPKQKDKIQRRPSSTNLSKPAVSGQDQGVSESVLSITKDKNHPAVSENSANIPSLTKSSSSEPVSDAGHDSLSPKASPSKMPIQDIEIDASDNNLSVAESNAGITTSATDSKSEKSIDHSEKSSFTEEARNEQAMGGEKFSTINAVSNLTNSSSVKINEEKFSSQRMSEASSISSTQANEALSATEPLPSSLSNHNEHTSKDDISSIRMQEQLDEAQGLLKSTVSTGQSKEARLARVCAGLSSRLQEYKSENAQLEELLVAERELSTSYQARIKQLEKELSACKTEVTRVESSLADVLAAKNSEIESLMNSVEALKKQTSASEGKLSSLQENMDTVLRNRELTETRMMQALREELATAERRAEEERTAHNATKLAAVSREVELEHRALEASNALARIQRSADESTSRATELEHKVVLLEVECASLTQELQEMEARARRGQKKSSEEANQLLQIQAWQEEVERARQSQRDAESKLSSLEADVQKMRVEMAGMKRDAEHYSRHEHMELEKRYRELTDLLYLKQTQFEAMASEKAAAEFQLEKEVRRHQEAQQLEVERSRSSRRASSSWEEDSDLKVLESLPLHHRHMAGASKQLEKAARLLDSGAVRATRILWRYPYARVVFLFYLVFVHLFLMYLLHRLQEQADAISERQGALSMGLNNSSLP